MALVTFKDLCIDANDVPTMQGFWARTLHLDSEFFDDDGTAVLRGHDPSQTIWINLVPEAREVKNRVHLDVVATSLEPFAGLVQVSEVGQFPWTVFEDPEGNQFCVFLHDGGRPVGLKDVIVDSVDHRSIIAWWADVWGGDIGHDDGYSYLDNVPNAPVESFDFGTVPEPKTVKNRIHWDVTLNEGVTVDDIVAKGATVLATPTEDEPWTVMGDPEGNEFCVFERQ